jgi:hypothetical protein
MCFSIVDKKYCGQEEGEKNIVLLLPDREALTSWGA